MDEKLLQLGVLERSAGEELERHGPPQTGILGLVDDSHAAFAELFADDVVTNGCADHGDWFERSGRQARTVDYP